VCNFPIDDEALMSDVRPIRLWYQLLSSETRLKNSIAATQAAADRVAAPGTVIEVRGTSQGALGDQYRLFWHYDVREVVDNGLSVRERGGYDAFVIANSLDPALTELREILDIPVISFMEVCCYTACTMGERFALIAPNERFIPHYEDIVRSYGLSHRLSSTEAVRFDNIGRFDDVFTNEAVGDELLVQMQEACARAIARGAEVIIPAGPSAAFMVKRKIFEIDGVPILDAYGLIVKAAEAMVAMHRATGVCVSRKRRYQTPPRSLILQCAEVRGIPALRNG
jgi:Asp/Glu/hydantoin racemase